MNSHAESNDSPVCKRFLSQRTLFARGIIKASRIPCDRGLQGRQRYHFM